MLIVKKCLRLNYVLFVFLSFSCKSIAFTNLHTKATERYPVDKPFAESEIIYIDGARLHVRQWKAEASEKAADKGVVFLIHGVSGSTYNWRYLAPALAADGWNVITADLPPFGFSGERQAEGVSLDPLPQDSKARAILLWNLFDSLYNDYSGQVVLVGHSLGGRMSAIMTLSKPEKVSKLVLLAPAVYGKSAIPAITKFWPFSKMVFPGARIGLLNIHSVRYVANKAYGRKVNEEEFIGNWAPFLRDGVPDACAEWTIKSIDTEAPEVSEIKNATLILWSEKDSIVPNRGARLQHDIVGSNYIEIPGKSHCIMDTDPEAVNSYLINFIN